ncbi:MAG: hypothetical protein ACR2P6_00730, partial [Gammaproteobacteria bacterium]
ALGPDGNLYIANIGTDAVERIVYQGDGGNEIIAEYDTDFVTGSPAEGWTYKWNATGTLENPASHTPLLWNGVAQYDSDGAAGLPDATEMGFGNIGQGTMHPGQSTGDGATNDRYAIAEYTVAESGYYAIQNSGITHIGCDLSDGVDVLVLVNNAVVYGDSVAQGEFSVFDTDLEFLTAGSTIAVAMGPKNSSQCDDATINWFISYEDGTPPVGNPPIATIDTPAGSEVWNINDIVNYSGHATDTEDGDLGAGSLRWEAIIHHLTHLHPDVHNNIGASGSFIYPDHGDDSYLELCLTATDSDNRSDTTCVDVRPDLVNYVFESVPSGLNITYNAQSFSTPFEVEVQAGSRRLISAPWQQNNHVFDSWSVGGQATQQYIFGDADATVTATYTEIASLPIDIDVAIEASSDDAEETIDGSMDLESTDLELTADATNQLVGMRFNNIDIDAGSLITEAYIQFTTDEVSTAPTALVLHGEASNNAITFDTTIGKISSRTLTNDSINWTPPSWPLEGEAGPNQRTPDISEIINEIIARPGWSRGNSLAIIVSGNGTRTAESINGSEAGAPVLHISYADPGGNQRPNLTITAPESGSNAFEGEPVNLTATAADIEDGDIAANIAWHSSQDGDLGLSGGSINPVLSLGTHTITASITDSGGKMDEESIILHVLPFGSIPQEISIRIGASSDDAEEKPEVAVNLISGDLELTWQAARQTVGLRFNGIGIEPGSIITEAYIQFTTDEIDLTTSSLTLQAQAADNAPTFSTAVGDVSSRTVGAAAVGWSPAPWTIIGEAGLTQRTPDISDIIAEVIGRDGWISGNSLAIIVTGTDEQRTAVSFDGQPSAAPLLHVKFAAPTGTNTLPSIGITGPADGSSYTVGENINFTATAGDTEDGDLTSAISWSSSINGRFWSTGGNVSAAPSVGIHTITASVTDSGGLTSTESITVNVTADPVNQAPTVSINSPVDGTTVDDATEVFFTGSAGDTEDGDLSSSISWSSSIDGSLGPDGPGASQVLSFGTHTITASVVDSGGEPGSDSITVNVESSGGNMLLNSQVGASFDDAEEDTSGIVDLISTDLELNFDATDQLIGVRFNNIAVPRGATIVNAWVQFTASAVNSEPTSLTIHGEATANAAAFSGFGANISTRALTSQNELWSPDEWTTIGEAGPAQRTGNIASVIGEITSRGDWTSGNSLALVISGSGKRVASSYNGSPGNAPLLHIEFDVSDTNAAPMISIANPFDGLTKEYG